MRYWIMTTECLPYYGGGIATYVDTMAKMLAADGHDVVVILSQWKEVEPIVVGRGDGYALVRFNPDLLSPQKGLGIAARLSYAFSNVYAKLVSQLGPPDFIEAQDFCGVAYFTLQRMLTLEPNFHVCPVVIRVHGSNWMIAPFDDRPTYTFPDYWTYEMEKFCLSAADLVLSPSRIADELVQAQFKDVRLVRSRNPLNLHDQSLNVSEPVTDGDIVFFGRIQPVKGIIELLKAYKTLESKNLPKLTVIGGGVDYLPNKRDLLEYLSEHYRPLVDEGKLEFLGALPRRDALARLDKAKAVIAPSRWELFGYAPLEAMYRKKLVIGSEDSGYSDFIKHREHALIYDFTKPSAFEKAIDDVAALGADDIQRMTQSARDVVESVCEPRAILEGLLEAVHQIPKAAKKKFPRIRESVEPDRADGQSLETSSSTLLSVVVPYYNMGAYVRETIESIYASVHRPIEILVINDGSTDLGSIARLYALPDPPDDQIVLKIHHKVNAGLSAARNTGAGLASGKYLAFLDADDAVTPEYFGRAIAVLERYENVGFVGCWLKYFQNSDGGFVTWNTELPYLLFHNCICSAGIVCKKSVFLESGLNDEDMIFGMEDYEAVIRMVANGSFGVALPHELFRYRVRSNSMMRQFTPHSQMLMYQKIMEKNPAVFQKYALELINLLNQNGPGWMRDNPTFPSKFI